MVSIITGFLITSKSIINMKDPILHSHITDCLPESHNLAYKNIFCKICSQHLHAFNNETMRTWIETGIGNYCITCFSNLKDSFCLGDEYGIKE